MEGVADGFVAVVSHDQQEKRLGYRQPVKTVHLQKTALKRDGFSVGQEHHQHFGDGGGCE